MADQDITAAKSTYSGFIAVFKWGTIASVAIAALVVILISN